MHVWKSDMIRDKNRAGSINVLSVLKLLKNNGLLWNNVQQGGGDANKICMSHKQKWLAERDNQYANFLLFFLRK